MSKKYTYENVKNYIEKNSNCKLLSDKYINVFFKLELLCHCGEVFEISFDGFRTKKNKECNKCSKQKSSKEQAYTYEHVKNFVELNDCELLSAEYKNSDTKLTIKCSCGNIFITSFYKFDKRNKRQCNECSNVKTYNKSDIKKLIEIDYSQVINTNFTFVSYENIIVYKDSDGYYYSFTNVGQLNDAIKKKKESLRFYTHNPFTIGNINNYVSRFAKGYKLLSHNYINGNQKLIFECPEGHIFKSRWYSFYHLYRRCPECDGSKHEKVVANYLKRNKIKYKREYRFKECKNINPLPFDFYLKDFNLCIECDGEQHYKSVEMFGGIEGFEKIKYHDQIKNNFCKNSNIKLLRIPYYDFDKIEQILDEKLKI